MRRAIFPILMGLIGCATLCALGLWQVQRLAWKEDMLARIEARIYDAPAAIPDTPIEDVDEYQPTQITGTIGQGALFVLKAQSGQSPAYRVIIPVQTATRSVLADLGTIPDQRFDAAGQITVTGNLHWPDETGRWTPPHDGALWFGRDVPAMAAALGTDPVLVVARAHDRPDLATTPAPVTTSGIANDHLGYAITWFGLALVWAVMSLFLIRRTIRSPQ